MANGNKIRCLMETDKNRPLGVAALNESAKLPVEEVIDEIPIEKIPEFPTSLPANGGNADTLDGLHATSFFQEIGSMASGNIKDYALNLVGSGAVFANSAVIDMPFDNSYWFVIINKCNTNHILMEATNIGSNKKYICSYNAGTTPPKWYDWSFVGDGGNAASVNTQTLVAPTSGFTPFYPAFVDANNNSATDENLKTNNAYIFQMKNGTASAEGTAQLILGNTILAGTDGNMKGQLVFFNNANAYYTTLNPSTAQTGNTTFALPTTSGTLALNTVATTSANGLMSAADKVKLNSISASGATIYTGTLTQATGTYTITLGVKPKFVLCYSNDEADSTRKWWAKSTSGGHPNITFTSTGFQYSQVINANFSQYFIALA